MKIITFTCDLYADAVPAYHYLWNRAWPDCPHEMIYVTNSKLLTVDATVHYLKGKDIEYGRRLRKFVSLHCKDNELGLFMMGDYFAKAINTKLVERAREACERDDVSHVRLRPMPHPSLPPPIKLNKDVFGGIDRTKRYSLSLQPGIWKPKDLARCVRDTWSAHRCELNGSRHTRRIKREFLSTQRPAIIHLNYYKGGRAIGVKWVRANVPREFWPEAARRMK